MKKEEIENLIKEAGEKKTRRFDWYFPFIHRYTWVFGGWCGLCGKWNWQWREKYSFCEATYACKECQKTT